MKFNSLSDHKCQQIKSKSFKIIHLIGWPVFSQDITNTLSHRDYQASANLNQKERSTAALGKHCVQNLIYYQYQQGIRPGNIGEKKGINQIFSIKLSLDNCTFSLVSVYYPLMVLLQKSIQDVIQRAKILVAGVGSGKVKRVEGEVVGFSLCVPQCQFVEERVLQKSQVGVRVHQPVCLFY